MEETLLVIDTGSSSMRSVLFDKYGRILEKYQTFYQMKIDGIKATQEIEDFSNALIKLVQKSVAYVRQHNLKIKSISFTSQRSSLVVLDEKMQVVLPVIMWYDKRSAIICQNLNAEHGNKIKAITGSLATPVMLAPKIQYFEQNSELALHAAYYMSIQDYLIWLTCGKMITDPTLGCKTNLMNLQKNQWSDELLALYKIDKKKLCKIIPCGSIAGYVMKAFEDLTGLTEGIPVITAGGDQQCSLLGQMLDYKSEMALTLGSGGYAVMTVEQIPQEIPDYVTVSASAWQGFYNLEIGIEKLGTLFDWCRNQFPQKDRNPKDFILLAQKANKTNARTEITMEQLKKCMIQNMDLKKEYFKDLDNETNYSHKAMAILNCIIQEISETYFKMCKATNKKVNIKIAGGMAKSDCICQMIVDTTSAVICRNKEVETTAVGAWLQSTVALEIENSISKAIKRYKNNNGNQNTIFYNKTINKKKGYKK